MRQLWIRVKEMSIPKRGIQGPVSGFGASGVRLQASGTNLKALHFLSNAKGSLFEVETQVLIADQLGYLTHLQGEDLLSQTAEVGRLLNGLMKAFRNIPAA